MLRDTVNLVKEIMKIRCQIYILMNKVIILRKIHMQGCNSWGVRGGARGAEAPPIILQAKKVFLLSYVKSSKVYIMDGEWIISTAFIITQIKNIVNYSVYLIIFSNL